MGHVIFIFGCLFSNVYISDKFRCQVKLTQLLVRLIYDYCILLESFLGFKQMFEHFIPKDMRPKAILLS
jgi:hypothetical protein